MPPLVEFAVIRQKYFRHDPEHMAAVDRDRAIVEPPLPPQRRADDEDRTQVFACRDQPLDLRLDRIEHRVLEQQIVDRIGRQRQLGKHHQRDPRRVAVAQERQRLVAVPGRLGDGDLRHARADPHELVTVRGKEGRHRTGCSRSGRLIAAPIWRFANGFVRGGGRHRAVRPGAPRTALRGQRARSRRPAPADGQAALRSGIEDRGRVHRGHPVEHRRVRVPGDLRRVPVSVSPAGRDPAPDDRVQHRAAMPQRIGAAEFGGFRVGAHERRYWQATPPLVRCLDHISWITATTARLVRRRV